MYDLFCLGRLGPVPRSLCRTVSCFSILQYKEQVRGFRMLAWGREDLMGTR